MEFLSTALEMAGIYFTTIARWLFVILAAFILIRQIRSLLRARNPSEIWAYLGCPDDTSVPLTHWENLIGRGRGCDVILNLNSVSRSHGTLIRDSAGVWKYSDLSSKNGSAINGLPVRGPTELKAGDILTIGGADFTLYPVSLQERMSNIENRKKKTNPVSPWPTLVALTLFQLLTVMQFKVSMGEEFPASLPVAFGLLCALMWAYVIFMRMFKRVGFEMEMIAFFLSTLSLAVTTAAFPDSAFKQALCVCLGVGLFFGLCWFLRDLNRAKGLTNILIGASVVLLIANLLLGSIRYGAQNWIEIGGFSFQPSELVKIVFVYVGAATLDELQKRKNLTIFMLFSVFCLGCLAIMGDFGTAIIFFVTFLIISFLRSGDFSKLILIVGAAGLMGMMVLRFKPYIADRFDTWGHVWEDPTDGGFQQVQTMTASASGGLPGLGAGNGNLSDVAASSTDLVFGLLSEEWGLIIAILSVLCIITLGVFAVRSIIAGRSTYYSIAACAATSLFIFQTILNVFGSLDLLPLTGVTFPFVSSGGTSMIASWGLLAFLKAADTRQNASFAIRLDRKDEFESELEGRGLENPEDIFEDEGNFSDDDFFKDLERAPSAGTDGFTEKPGQRRDPAPDPFLEKLEQSRPPAPDPFLEKLEKSRPDAKKRSTARKPAGRPTSRSASKPAQRPAVRASERASEQASGRGTSRPNQKEERPLTLDDIFGDDKK
ncbi:MAG: FtsW/RodA/SpoVE family cell cycle protein [Bacillota bacterium]|nr:FtsW/RodA/SpoVE family cell cycle protein [Bacillota bacterium]